MKFEKRVIYLWDDGFGVSRAAFLAVHIAGPFLLVQIQK
jgi:hypothetical protein